MGAAESKGIRACVKQQGILRSLDHSAGEKRSFEPPVRAIGVYQFVSGFHCGRRQMTPSWATWGILKGRSPPAPAFWFLTIWMSRDFPEIRFTLFRSRSLFDCRAMSRKTASHFSDRAHFLIVARCPGKPLHTFPIALTF